MRSLVKNLQVLLMVGTFAGSMYTCATIGEALADRISPPTVHCAVP